MSIMFFVLLMTAIVLANASPRTRNIRSTGQITENGSPDLTFDVYDVPCITDSQNATAFALVYGAPLISVASFLADPIANGTNKLYNQRELATASSAAVVRPNVDTLYTRVAVDLSQNDVSITVPEINDRFYVFPFYDIFGSNFANLGSINNTVPGQYLLRRVTEMGGNPGFELETDPGSEYKGYINFPGSYGFMLIRILLLTSPTSQIDAETAIVTGYQDQTIMISVGRNYSTAPASLTAPPLSNELLNGSLTGTHSQQILELTSRIAPYNQPAVLDTAQNVSFNLHQAGIDTGHYQPAPNVNLTLAEEISEAVSGSYLAGDIPLIWSFGNNWAQYIPSASGDFHSMFPVRSYTALTGLAQLQAYESLYPEQVATSLSLSIGANQSSLYTFSGKPSVTGFWSLTLYGPDSYLISNTLNRYNLGDRSNLTYPDGNLVYGDDNSSSSADDEDRPFTILLQPADLPPPANWTSNWLPAPAGGGNYSVNLRFYGPAASLKDGSYAFPIVVTGPAIV